MRRNRKHLPMAAFGVAVLTAGLLSVGPLPSSATRSVPNAEQGDRPNPEDEQVDPASIDTVPIPDDGKGNATGKGNAKGNNGDGKGKPSGGGQGVKKQHHEVRLQLHQRDAMPAGSASGLPVVGRVAAQVNRPMPQAEVREAKPKDQTANAGKNAVDPIDLKILVVSADGQESDLPTIQQTLRQLGIPFETMIAKTAPDLVPSKLWDGGVHGYYQAVILATGGLAYYDPATNSWPSAFTAAEWATLWDYEARFGIRQVTSYTYPGGFPDSYGLNIVTYQDTLTSPLQATLTASGKQVFSDLNPNSPVTFEGAWVYLATVANPAVTTPLITTPQGYAIASITTYPDGRQNLAVTAANNTELIHSLLLSYGLVNWATKGLFLGERHVNSSYQIDDLYIDDDIWDPVAKSDLTGLSYRNNAADIMSLINWQNGVRANPLTSSFRVEWAFNGEGASGIYAPDDLTPAIKTNQAQFNFVNHTYTHQNLDPPTTAATVTSELSRNHNFRATVPFVNYSRDSMVQPDISGLTNPAFFQAASQFGIRYMISDTSRPGWNNPSPNAGFPVSGFPNLLVIPRRPTNLFYNLSTPTEWASEFNYYYAPGGIWAFFDHPLSYAEIIDVESNWLLKYLLKWDIDPLMFHQPNVRAYDGVHSLLGDLVDSAFTKYQAAMQLSVRNQTEHAVGRKMTDRMNYDQSGTTASLVPCTSVTITAARAARVPVTGVAFGTNREVYGGQNISYIALNAGQSVTIPTTVC